MVGSVRTLQRNIDSQYYYHLLASQNSQPVKEEMKKITAPYQADKLEFIKNRVVAEFLGFSAQAVNTRERSVWKWSLTG